MVFHLSKAVGAMRGDSKASSSFLIFAALLVRGSWGFQDSPRAFPPNRDHRVECHSDSFFLVPPASSALCSDGSKEKMASIKWVDYSERQRGVALLNFGPPGHLLTDGTLMLSLLRSHNLGAYGFGGGSEPGMSSETGFELGQTAIMKQPRNG